MESINELKYEMESHQIAHRLNESYDMLYSFIFSVLRPDEWDFTENSYLNFIHDQVASSGHVKIGQMFGNNPISSLLLLSTVETRIQKDAEFESGLCRDMSFLTKFKTIIPYGQAAKPTENESKFILDDGHFVWISKKSFMGPSKFRPANKFSLSRIIKSDEHIDSILVVNNTLLLIQANLTAWIHCQNKSQQIHINGSAVLKIPTFCKLSSIHLNISSYNVINMAEQKVLTVSTEYPSLHYHDDIQNMSRVQNLEEEELNKLMKKVLEKKKEINKIESNVLEQDGLKDTARKALNWFDKKWEQWELICIVVSFSIVVTIVLLVILVVIYKFCYKQK